MINSFDVSGALATDAQSVAKLRLLAKKDPDQALKATARQFEALFMNMLLKSMREATPKDGMLDSEQTRFYTSMLDQQLAQNLSAKGVGLADIMVRQLSRPALPAPPSATPAAAPAVNTNTTPEPQPDAIVPAAPRNTIRENDGLDSEQTRFYASMLDPQLTQNLSAQGIDNMIKQLSRTVVPAVPPPAVPAAIPPAIPAPAPRADAIVPPAARDFVNMVWPHAQAASRATGIRAHFVVAQAALESGWGKHEIRRADGGQSYNLFGVKAGRNWLGPVVEAVTIEYVNGVPQKTVEKFRAYGSYAEGFRDYAKLLLNNPRYAAVLEQQDAAGFARGLQRAGYATDPTYADKLTRILNGTTLRQNLTA